MTTYFIADLHLSPFREDITDCFLRFMANKAPQAEALYILGDLFEFWVGDDDDSPFNQQILSAFKQLTDQGVPCYFVHGNRDFLVGKRFTQHSGVQILDEVSCIELYQQKVVILHGDTLCLDDVDYLKFRAKMHNPIYRFIYRLIPLSIRRKIVTNVQQKARNQKKDKSLDIMDVTQSEVVRLLEENESVLMIHGHTHKPNIHHFETKHGQAKRIVLGDWYQQGSILIVDENEQQLHELPFSFLTPKQ